MPLNQHLWSKNLLSLPKKEQLKARKAIKELKNKSDQRKILQKQPITPPDHIFYQHIVKNPSLIFVSFYWDLEEYPTNTFKFHISISPQDYEAVLYKSGLNQLLQKYLVDSPDKRAIHAFKYVDPELLKKTKTQEQETYGNLLHFYQLIEEHNALGREDNEKKFHLFNNISCWHTWLTEAFEDSCLELNTLLEATPSELSAYKNRSIDLFQEIANTSSRFEQEVQYTLYVQPDANKENLIELIKTISEYLTKMGIRPVACPSLDLPLTNFISFRQDRDKVDGMYVPVDHPDCLKLKAIAQESEIYEALSCNC